MLIIPSNGNREIESPLKNTNYDVIVGIDCSWGGRNLIPHVPLTDWRAIISYNTLKCNCAEQNYIKQ